MSEEIEAGREEKDPKNIGQIKMDFTVCSICSPWRFHSASVVGE